MKMTLGKLRTLLTEAVADPYRVLEDDHHNQPSVHLFRDEEQFISWIETRFADEFDREEWEEDGTWDDPNSTTWSYFAGIYEVDHTSE